ncbi:putative E3 ubiquitin-protein ligase HACE1, partial [Cardiosporidium cionae]
KGCGVLSFENKKRFLRIQLKDFIKEKYNSTTIVVKNLFLSVERSHVLEDTIRTFYNFKQTEFYKDISSVHFIMPTTNEREEGIALGPIREFWSVLSEELREKADIYFRRSLAENRFFLPTGNSMQSPFYLGLGRLLAFAILNNKTVDVPFAPSVWSFILWNAQQNLSIEDLQEWDSQLYKNLKMLLEGSLDPQWMCLTFSVGEEASQADHFSQEEGNQPPIIVDLKENGRNCDVTSENKKEYIQSIVNYKLRGCCLKELECLRKGFSDILDLKILQMFTPREMDLLVAGEESLHVDVMDWKLHTDYIGYSPQDKQIQWFWNFVMHLHTDEQRLLLRFCTGSSKPPYGGFKNMKSFGDEIMYFCIKKWHTTPSALPSASTCLNTLHLPLYSMKEILEEKLFVAIRYGNQGFTFL